MTILEYTIVQIQTKGEKMLYKNHQNKNLSIFACIRQYISFFALYFYSQYWKLCPHYIFDCFILEEKEKIIIMATGNSSQSQPSYFHYTNDQKPNFQVPPTIQLLDQNSASIAMNNITSAMGNAEGQQFQQCLQTLHTLFSKGYSNLFITHSLLMRKMMNHFTKLGKQIEDDKDNSKTEFRMLYIISLIAQLLRNNSKFYYPFTRKFLITLFFIDAELIEKSSMKKQILAILGVLYENISRQPKLVSKYGIEAHLKQAVLTKYRLIQETFTLKLMNKTITNLVSKGIQFSVGDFSKHKVLDTVSKIISSNQMDLFFIKMQMTMLKKKNDKPEKAGPSEKY